MFSSISRSAVAIGLVMLLLVAACGGIGYWGALSSQDAISDLESVTVVVQRHMESDMKHDAIRGDVAAAIAALDPETGISMKDSQTAIRQDSAEFLQLVAEAKQNASDPAVLAALLGLDAPLRAYTSGAQSMLRLLSDDPGHAAAAFPAFDRKFLVLQVAMDKASHTIEAYAKTHNASETATANRVQKLMLIAILASVALLGAVGLFVRAKLVRPMLALGNVTYALAGGNYGVDVPETARGDELGIMARGLVELRDAGRAKLALEAESAANRTEQLKVVGALGEGLAALRLGDFTKMVEGDFAAEYVVLKDNFNHAVGALREMMQSVNSITHGIRAGSEDIARAADDLARSTEGNAASLEQTSAALVQIDGRLKTSAASSRTTVTRADQAIATVDSGRSVAVEAVSAMGRVRESAKGIDDVIEGLDKIAFQTRVLAMNAAVEAGRAGDAGRGFAVVADLVSALAMRAEEEAKRARDQLSVTQTQVVSAVAAVEMVDGALAAIAGDVGAVHALLQAMATDNQAQALAVTEIAAAVASMDQSTQQNAAMVELTASAARALNGNVNTLVEKAEIFKFERRTRSTAVSVERRSGTLAGAITTRALPPLSAASHASANDRHRGQAVAAE